MFQISFGNVNKMCTSMFWQQQFVNFELPKNIPARRGLWSGGGFCGAAAVPLPKKTWRFDVSSLDPSLVGWCELRGLAFGFVTSTTVDANGERRDDFDAV